MTEHAPATGEPANSTKEVIFSIVDEHGVEAVNPPVPVNVEARNVFAIPAPEFSSTSTTVSSSESAGVSTSTPPLGWPYLSTFGSALEEKFALEQQRVTPQP